MTIFGFCYTRFLDNLQDAYFQADKTGNFMLVNPQAVRMYRYSSASELIGQPALTLYADPDDRIRLIDELKDKGKVADYTSQGIRKDGSIFWASMNVQFIRDDQGAITGTEGLVRDITERIEMLNEIKLQRDSLVASNKKLAFMLEQSVSAISKIGELRDVYTAGH